ncbi:hypothetical protein V1264_018379 [Littorina saxatilis]|uniref:Uncharacterized protein n=1 Tax=Littorina saxatilis TaxID=31220 RepID=A0AAN9BEX5_9CAEN
MNETGDCYFLIYAVQTTCKISSSERNISVSWVMSSHLDQHDDSLGREARPLSLSSASQAMPTWCGCLPSAVLGCPSLLVFGSMVFVQ